MLKKIISCGQTDADRAALDTAIKFNLDHGGWVSFKSQREAGDFFDQENLTKMEREPSQKNGEKESYLKRVERESYLKRSEENIVNSGGTLIISSGVLSGSSLMTRKTASRLNKPWCHIDLMDLDEFEGAVILHGFVADHNLEVLNIAGQRAAHDPFIYRSVKSIIETVIYMELMERYSDELRSDDIILFQRKAELLCTTIEDAVRFLADTMQLRSRSVIANSNENEIGSLYFSLSDTIKVKLGLDSDNSGLLEACRQKIRKGDNFGADVMDIEDATMVILKELRQFLKESHVLRIIK